MFPDLTYSNRCLIVDIKVKTSLPELHTEKWFENRTSFVTRHVDNKLILVEIGKGRRWRLKKIRSANWSSNFSKWSWNWLEVILISARLCVETPGSRTPDFSSTILYPDSLRSTSSSVRSGSRTCLLQLLERNSTGSETLRNIAKSQAKTKCKKKN